MGYFFGWLITWLITGSIFGLITRHVAESKGYDGGFAWGFWLGLIGLLVVGFRPNLETQSVEYKPMYPNAIQEKTTWESTWECGCGSKNPSTLDYCLSCRRKKGEAAPRPKVKCPHCGANNSADNQVCFACNKSLKEETMQTSREVESVRQDSNGSVEMLEKLAQLRDKGILSEEEFANKKGEILAKM